VKNDYEAIFEISILNLKTNFRMFQIILYVKTLLQAKIIIFALTFINSVKKIVQLNQLAQ